MGRQTVAGTLRSPGEVVNGLYQVVSLLTVAPEQLVGKPSMLSKRGPAHLYDITGSLDGDWMALMMEAGSLNSV